MYSGHVCIWNYETSTLVNSFEATELPVRTVKFIPRKQWLVCGADDMTIRVYNYNTMEKVVQFEAHQDYIRHVAVHPTLPLVISCSDDMTIKLWDWDKDWMCTQLFEGHGHYVMHVAFNPKDTNTVAAAGLDRTVKVWSLGSPVPNFTLEGHERGVNCVDYYVGGDKPYLVSGADDSLVKIWDYQTKACIQTLDGHSHNVSCVKFHTELPLILTGSEDGTLKMWHSTTYRLESSLNYGMERTWAIATARGSNAVAIGYDEGCVMITMGREDPLVSMDASGKVIWARHNEIQTVNIKALGDDAGATSIMLWNGVIITPRLSRPRWIRCSSSPSRMAPASLPLRGGVAVNWNSVRAPTWVTHHGNRCCSISARMPLTRRSANGSMWA